MTVKGLWIDDSPQRVLDPDYFKRLQDIKIDEIAVMVETAGRLWDPIWSNNRLEMLRDLSLTYGIDLALTIWPEPSPNYLDAMEKALPKMMKSSGAVEIEVDCEFNWKSSRLRGFRSMESACDRLVKIMASTGVRKCLTTFTAHTENGTAAQVAPHMDLLLPQAYSVVNRNGQVVKVGDLLGPARMQAYTLDKTLSIPGVGSKIQLGCGLAAYDQGFPIGRENAMEAAFQAAVEKGAKHIRWWSSKWVVGARKQKWSADFITSVGNPDDDVC